LPISDFFSENILNASGGQKPFREKVSGLPKAFGSEKIFFLNQHHWDATPSVSSVAKKFSCGFAARVPRENNNSTTSKKHI